MYDVYKEKSGRSPMKRHSLSVRRAGRSFLLITPERQNVLAPLHCGLLRVTVAVRSCANIVPMWQRRPMPARCNRRLPRNRRHAAQGHRSGLARLDPLGIGIDVTSDWAVIDQLGTASERLFALGPLTRAAFWEIVAIPDIRDQCPALATRLSRWRCYLPTICIAP